jgi:GNAT superfamily N-acetyltransferase
VVINGEDDAAGAVLTVRSRTEDDLDECVRVLAEVHRSDGYPMRWPDDPARWLARPKIPEAWVATLDGRLVGHVGLALAGPADAAPKLYGGRVAMVSRLFVSPAARGHGAGRVLLGRAVRAASERGLHPVLDVEATSVAAIAFYERLGWHLLGSSEAQWGSRRVTVFCYAAPADEPGTGPVTARPSHA